jgi:hypothetical protein
LGESVRILHSEGIGQRSLVSRYFYLISDPMMHEQRDHPLCVFHIGGSQQELATTEVPKNIIAGKSELTIR